MITFTVITEPTTASVLLTVTETGTNSAATFSLMRTDVNGSSPVRLLAGQTISGGSLVVRDYEASLSGSVSYVFLSGQTGEAAITRAVSLDLDRDVLSVATLPQYRARPVASMGFSAELPSRGTRHDIIGRTDPVFTLEPMGLREGTLELKAASRQDAEQLASVWALGEVALYRFAGSTGRDIYHVPTAVSYSPDLGFASWTVTASYSEVARPSGPLRGSLAWTYQNVKARTYAQIKATYPTYAALTIGATS